MVDKKSQKFRRYSQPTQRPQTDQGRRPGEQTMSSEDLWPRAYVSFHRGAGQSSMELDDADPYRYWKSQGLDPWTRGEVTLLNDTAVSRTSANSNLQLFPLPTRLALTDYDTIRWFDGATWTSNTLATTVGKATTDGTYVYAACADGKIKRIAYPYAFSDAWTLSNVDMLVFAKGRLIAGAANVLYDLKPGVAATAQTTIQWTEWRWSAGCEGPKAIYAAGSQGDKSLIYRLPLKSDGTGLDAAVVAAPLPDGELVTSMASYLGYVIVGTTKGVRFAVADDQGDLNLGSPIPTPAPVYCLEPQDRFVWFGWSNYDSGVTGLGRMDLREFIASLTPAYASDLMYGSAGTVRSVVTYGGVRWFTIDGVGVIKEAATPVAEGHIELSNTDYGITDKKVAELIDLRNDGLKGAIDIWLDVDKRGYAPIATSNISGATASSYRLANQEGHLFQVKLVLTLGETAPVLRQVRLLSHPLPTRSAVFELPLLVADTLDVFGSDEARDPLDDSSYLIGLVNDGRSVSLQMGNEAYSVYPSGYEWLPMSQSYDKTGWQGTLLIQLREVHDG